MKTKKKDKNQHCCELMEKFVSDPRIGINYNQKFREYSIDLILIKAAKQDIFHCPFCGFKLPRGLREEYCNILEGKFGIDCIFDSKKIERLPEEFKNDEWWKKRGL